MGCTWGVIQEVLCVREVRESVGGMEIEEIDYQTVVFIDKQPQEAVLHLIILQRNHVLLIF